MPYIKEVFDVVTFDQAKDVVLSNSTTETGKFEKETNFLVDKIQQNVDIDETKTILDFGCGMGRVSKELINRFNCKVVGLDISPSMLMFAKIYTAKPDNFFGTLAYNNPESIDIAIAILALQHSENPKKEIDNIISNLKPNGTFVLLNENKRFVPSGVDTQNYVIWNDDGFDIFSYVEQNLEKIKTIPYLDTNKQIIFYRKQT